MSDPTRLLGVFAVLLAVLLGGVLPADADDGRVPRPVLAQGKGENCLEPAATMRRYHMNYLKHQREETLYRGIRGTKYSIKKCIDCHATPDPENGGVRTVEHFCAECHRYAAVPIDCFDCHTGKPDPEPNHTAK